ncbi:MBL fold metallo-hydrolase [Agarilytica rhodophyticola]|uniref:MBL fold metallo-hydrolase n=1 Tax=Agarilytica rhodophyticola TaxID=1737490 RepID=UPI000B34937F|nr:MBL fold metallo-hydrolase [Agarilytica rhodophyticola]
MDFQLLKVGHCFHPEAMVMKGHSWKKMAFPAIVALLKHPKFGNILFDTGYAKRFLEETNSFPNILYRMLTPMHLCDKEGLITQLNNQNIGADDVDYIFISHFHADHIAGLLDYPKATFICSRIALESFEKRSGFSALIKGYLKGLLPNSFLSRALFIEDTKAIKLNSVIYPFDTGHDIFSDGSMFAISLPGHAWGHYGLLSFSNNQVNFLVGDACWTQEAYKFGARPNRLTRLIMSNEEEYLETLTKLTKLYDNNKSINIIPSHCQKTFEAFNSCWQK